MNHTNDTHLSTSHTYAMKVGVIFSMLMSATLTLTALLDLRIGLFSKSSMFACAIVFLFVASLLGRTIFLRIYKIGNIFFWVTCIGAILASLYDTSSFVFNITIISAFVSAPFGVHTLFNNIAQKNEEVYVSKKVAVIVLGALIIFGILARRFGIESMSTWLDEGLSVAAANSFAQGGDLALPSGAAYERAAPYHYYIGTLIRVFSPHIHTDVLLRLANIPFFTTNILLVYVIARKTQSRAYALFASFLFSSSWVAISMFREIRFYEFALTTFLLTVWVTVSYLAKKHTIISNVRYALMFAGVFYVGFLIHPLITIILYSIGSFFLIGSFIFKDKIYLALGALTGAGIGIGMFLLAKRTFPFISSFHFSYIFKIPSTEWASLTVNPSLATTALFLVHNGFVFLIPTLLVVPAIIFHTQHRPTLFIAIATISSYLFLAYQGFDPNSIRYYYVTIPLFAITFTFILSRLNGKYSLVRFLIILLTMPPFIAASAHEVFSPYTYNSAYTMKSFDFKAAFQTIQNTNVCQIVTDIQTSVPYFTYTAKKPDLILRDPDRIEREMTIDHYLGVPYTDYTSLKKSSCGTAVALIYMRTQITDESWHQMQQLGTLIYQDKALLVYILK